MLNFLGDMGIGVYMILEIIRFKNYISNVLQRLGIIFDSGDNDYEGCSLQGLVVIYFKGYRGDNC